MCNRIKYPDEMECIKIEFFWGYPQLLHRSYLSVLRQNLSIRYSNADPVLGHAVNQMPAEDWL